MPADEPIAPILSIEGSLPHALSGRFLGLEPRSSGSRVHSLVLCGGTATSYRHQLIPTSTSGARTTNLVEFADRVLALADGSVANGLSTRLETTPVDAAGHHLAVGAYPKTDPLSGELHLLSSPGEEGALHHVISAGGMTRRTRPIAAAPKPVLDLAITKQRLVLITDHFAGVTGRFQDAPIDWLPTEVMRSGRIIAAHDEDGDVIVHLVRDGLERWKINTAAGRLRRLVLDVTRQRPGRLNESFTVAPHRYVYAIGGDRGSNFAGGTLFKHDVVAGTREDHAFGGGHRAGDFAFAVDPARQHDEDGGWLLGFVHDHGSNRTSLRVLDAAHPTGPVLADVRLPRPIPHPLRCLWVPGPPISPSPIDKE